MGTMKSQKSHKNDSLIHASTNDKELVINYCCHFMFLNNNTSYLLLDNNNEHGLSSLSFVVIGKKNSSTK
jgi:hypothetical protein